MEGGGATNERVRREVSVLITDLTLFILLFGSAQASWYGQVPTILKGLDTIVTSQSQLTEPQWPMRIPQ